MRVASTLRVLSLPAAVALGAALAVACSDGAPVGPDPLQPAFKKQGKGGSVHPNHDDSPDQSCTNWGAGYVLVAVNPGSGVDDDGDGWVCKYKKP